MQLDLLSFLGEVLPFVPEPYSIIWRLRATYKRSTLNLGQSSRQNLDCNPKLTQRYAYPWSATLC